MAQPADTIDHTDTAAALLERINTVIVLASDTAPPTQTNDRRIAEAREALNDIAGFFDITPPTREAR